MILEEKVMIESLRKKLKDLTVILVPKVKNQKIMSSS